MAESRAFIEEDNTPPGDRIGLDPLRDTMDQLVDGIGRSYDRWFSALAADGETPAEKLIDTVVAEFADSWNLVSPEKSKTPEWLVWMAREVYKIKMYDRQRPR